jgi:hypothetical protein
MWVLSFVHDGGGDRGCDCDGVLVRDGVSDLVRVGDGVVLRVRLTEMLDVSERVGVFVRRVGVTVRVCERDDVRLLVTEMVGVLEGVREMDDVRDGVRELLDVTDLEDERDLEDVRDRVRVSDGDLVGDGDGDGLTQLLVSLAASSGTMPSDSEPRRTNTDKLRSHDTQPRPASDVTVGASLTLYPLPSTLHPPPSTLHPPPSTLHPPPSTLPHTHSDSHDTTEQYSPRVSAVEVRVPSGCRIAGVDVATPQSEDLRQLAEVCDRRLEVRSWQLRPVVGHIEHRHRDVVDGRP